jgi:hypothetical protein
MSVKAVQVNVVTSVDNFLALVESVVADVKAGKAPATVVADAVPELVTALASVGDLAGDVANKKALETTVALRLANLVNILAP